MSRVRELQKGVAKQCMLQMNISLTAINDFDNKDIVYSENMDGKISRIRKEERDFIKKFEKENRAVVYYVLASSDLHYRTLNFFFVSNEHNRWCLELNNVREGSAICYVKNLDVPTYSTTQKIYFKQTEYGLYRYR